MVYARRASEGGGAVRLTNMIRGPQVVFGGVRPSFKWLTFAAKQAIVGAFGDDGYAVIGATNQYLNGIAASDRDKATALAGFINEDPMMVCSLGLEPSGMSIPMPIRWIVGDGNSYIKTGIVLTRDAVISEALAIYTHTSNTNNSIFGAYLASSAYYVVSSWDAKYFIARGGSSQYTQNIQVNVEKLFRIEYLNGKRTAYIDGTMYGQDTGSTFTTLAMYLMARNNSGNADLLSKHKAAYIKFMAADETPNYWFVPYIVGTNGLAADKVSTGVAQAAGAKGMLDIVNCIFYPNAGTGQFTIPDISYTPSTP